VKGNDLVCCLGRWTPAVPSILLRAQQRLGLNPTQLTVPLQRKRPRSPTLNCAGLASVPDAYEGVP
jgi:hypothetical protein